MLFLAALISDPMKAGHAVQKLRERGIAPDAIRTIVRDPAAARAVAHRSQGERLAVLLTGAIAGVLAGGMAGWVLGSHIDPLSPPRGALCARRGGRRPTAGRRAGRGPSARDRVPA